MYITPSDRKCTTCGHIFKFSESWVKDSSRWPVTFEGEDPVCPKCWDKLLRQIGVGKVDKPST